MTNQIWFDLCRILNYPDNLYPMNNFDGSVFRFFFHEIPFISYAITMRQKDFIIALDIKHELLFKLYKPYLLAYCSLYPYDFHSEPRLISCYKYTSLKLLKTEFENLISTTFQKVIQIYQYTKTVGLPQIVSFSHLL